MTVKNRGKRKADASSSQDSELEVCDGTHLTYLFCFPHLCKHMSGIGSDNVVGCCVCLNSLWEHLIGQEGKKSTQKKIPLGAGDLAQW